MLKRLRERLGNERAWWLRQICVCAAVLVGYYIFTQLTGIYIPCVFRKVTGLKCPGCGVSHMLVKMLHFDFRGAYAENQLLFFMLPALFLLLAVKIIFLPKWLRSDSRVLAAIMFVCIAAAVVFGVARNV